MQLHSSMTPLLLRSRLFASDCVLLLNPILLSPAVDWRRSGGAAVHVGGHLPDLPGAQTWSSTRTCDNGILTIAMHARSQARFPVCVLAHHAASGLLRRADLTRDGRGRGPVHPGRGGGRRPAALPRLQPAPEGELLQL
eukprot:SAG22_NODE_932_length_6448_cov_7.053709_8_plen_139_part_00